MNELSHNNVEEKKVKKPPSNDYILAYSPAELPSSREARQEEECIPATTTQMEWNQNGMNEKWIIKYMITNLRSKFIRWIRVSLHDIVSRNRQDEVLVRF